MVGWVVARRWFPLRLISPIRSGVLWKLARQPYQLRRLWRLATRPPTRTSARSLIWSPHGSARSAAAERGLNELRIRRAVPQGTGLREQEPNPNRARPAAANTALVHVQQATADQLLAALKEAASVAHCCIRPEAVAPSRWPHRMESASETRIVVRLLVAWRRPTPARSA
jgi:hypothetical protein